MSIKTVTKIISEFEESKLELLNFISDNDKVFELFFALSDDYNQKLTEAKQELRNLKGTKMTLGSFHKGAAPRSVKYDPEKLPQQALCIPGVVKSVDTAMVEKLVLEGEIDASVASQAKEEFFGTPRIKGPKEITVLL